MANVLFLWREQEEVELQADKVQRLLESDQEVEGLADLPIREILDRVKAEFPGCRENAGLLAWNSGDEAFRMSWTWQYVRIECENLHEENRDKFFELSRHFGCPIFDRALNLRLGA